MNIREVTRDHDYRIEGTSVLGLIAVMDRLYDDSEPLKVDERRDLAQRLHALLETAEEML